MLCAACKKREGRWLGWFNPVLPRARRKIYRACSTKCQNDLATRRRDVVDPTEGEIKALQAASEPAGEYLESIGKTDLATLTEDEWMTFLEVVVTAYQDNLPPPF